MFRYIGVSQRSELLILAIFLTLAALSPRAFAADKGSQFGLLWGLSVPDADNTNPFHLFGVKGETFMSPKMFVKLI